MTPSCPCPGRITNPKRHVEWHAEVLAAGGPAGIVNVETLRAARAPPPDPAPPSREDRARRYAELKADARRRGAYAEHYPAWQRRG